MEWRQKTTTSWVAKDLDGYALSVRQRGSLWHWTIRPPGGGYDLFTGNAGTADGAKTDAEQRYDAFMAELLARPMRPPPK